MVRPLQSIAETQLQLHPALLRLSAITSHKTEGSFDQPKGRDAADGVSRNVLAPCKGGLRRDVPLTELLGGANRQGDYRHDQANEEELPQFHADVEEKKSERDGVLRQADFA